MPAFLVCNENTAGAVLSQSTAVIAVLSTKVNEVAELPISIWEQEHPDRYLQVSYHHLGWSWMAERPEFKFWDCLGFIESCLQRFGYDLNFAIYSYSNTTSAYTLALLLYAYWSGDPHRAIALVEQQSPLKYWEEVDQFMLHHFSEQQSLKNVSRQLLRHCEFQRAKRRSFLREQNRLEHQRARQQRFKPELQLDNLDWLDLE